MAAWITIDDLKTELGIPLTSTAYDAQLTLWRDQGTVVIESWCKRSFGTSAHIEYLTGNNTQRLTLKQTPVTDVAQVLYDADGSFGRGPEPAFDPTSNELVEGVDWTLDRDSDGGISSSGILFRIGTVWPVLHLYRLPNKLSPTQGPSWGNIKVVYTAGYSTIPADLVAALVLLVAYWRRTMRVGGPIKGERLGRYAYELFSVDPNKSPEIGTITSILSSYREIGW